MDFGFDARTLDLRKQLLTFMDERVYPAEAVYTEQVEAAEARGQLWERAPVTADLKAEARSRGLWNLFLTGKAAQAVRKLDPSLLPDPQLTNLQYAPLAEITGWSGALAPEALNCAAPDTGNMELLAEFGSPDQQQQWLLPLLEGTIRSAFCMTEPDVASSDATNIATAITPDGDGYVINGRKWWSSGAMSSDCKVFIVMGVGGDAEPDSRGHGRHSQILVPSDTPGVTVKRGMRVFGYTDGTHGGHAEVLFDNVRVPRDNLISGEGAGFAIAQARLGPGRIHHCMRQIGAAERALELMCRRAVSRTAFGKPLAEQGVIQDWIAQSELEIEQARLLTLKAAWMIDTLGKKAAQKEIAMIKIVAPAMLTNVVDRAIQVFGGAGVSNDFPLASMWAHGRTLHLVDGPDEVHKRSLARQVIRQLAQQ